MKQFTPCFALILSAAFAHLAMAQPAPDSYFTKKPAEKNFILVERVMSADSIRLEDGRRIKLIGLNAPQAPKKKQVVRDSYGIIIDDTNPETTVEEQAFELAKSLLEKKRVRLEFDEENKDADGYIFAYVFLADGTFVNEEILRQGFANLKIAPPNTAYADTLRKAYQEARREKRGLQGE